MTGVDDAGNEERIVIWIERKSGAVWAVGRSVNPQLRSSDEPRQDEYLFEGYELDDALEKANDVLEDEVSVLESDRRTVDVKPFLRKELLGPLERWFFGRSTSTLLLSRPLQIRGRNRISVRIVCRIAERLVDALLELFRESVLEPVGLVVDVVDVQPERLREVQLEQPVVTDHLERDALTASVSSTPR